MEKSDWMITGGEISLDFDLLKPGEPCGHKGCLHHVTHPCGGCGRIAGRGYAYKGKERRALMEGGRFENNVSQRINRNPKKI